MGTSVPPVQRIPSQLLAALTTRSFSSKHWAVLGTGSKEGEINFSASTCCRQTHVHPVTPGRSRRDFFFPTMPPRQARSSADASQKSSSSLLEPGDLVPRQLQ